MFLEELNSKMSTFVDNIKLFRLDIIRKDYEELQEHVIELGNKMSD